RFAAKPRKGHAAHEMSLRLKADGQRLLQKRRCAVISIRRLICEDCDVTWPKVLEVGLVLGPENCGWLVALRASRRICRALPSRNTLKSRITDPLIRLVLSERQPEITYGNIWAW